MCNKQFFFWRQRFCWKTEDSLWSRNILNLSEELAIEHHVGAAGLVVKNCDCAPFPLFVANAHLPVAPSRHDEEEY
jgi:hypothetical protein